MRTTVDIPDPTYRKLKAKAAADGCSVKHLILQSVARDLRAGQRGRRRIRLPIVSSRQAGALRLTNEQIYELIGFP